MHDKEMTLDVVSLSQLNLNVDGFISSKEEVVVDNVNDEMKEAVRCPQVQRRDHGSCSGQA
jgi:hypothetical protein